MALATSKVDRDFGKFRDAGSGNTKVAVVIEQPEGISVTSTTLIVLVDEVSSSVTYIGEASSGTLTSAASWRIKKVEISGSVTSILYSGGDTLFDKIWNDRASLTYS